MDRSARHLRLLTETIAAVNSTLDLEEVLSQVATNVAASLEADACFVYLYDEQADELVADGYTLHACVDSATLRPTRVPDWLAGAIRSAESSASPS